MHAPTVDEAEVRLRELRLEEWYDLAVSGFAIALALAAAERAPSLALPLLIGGLALGALGIRALWRHWDLVDRLADKPDAYEIPEVLEYAARETTMERRRRYAALIHHYLSPASMGRSGGFDAAASELAALADELEDVALELSPACAVACSRLCSDPSASPLLNLELPQDELRWRARRIRSGFTSRQTR